MPLDGPSTRSFICEYTCARHACPCAFAHEVGSFSLRRRVSVTSFAEDNRLTQAGLDSFSTGTCSRTGACLAPSRRCSMRPSPSQSACKSPPAWGPRAAHPMFPSRQPPSELATARSLTRARATGNDAAPCATPASRSTTWPTAPPVSLSISFTFGRNTARDRHRQRSSSPPAWSGTWRRFLARALFATPLAPACTLVMFFCEALHR